MWDFLYAQALSTVFTIISLSVKNPESKEKWKVRLLAIRNAINSLYPGE